jgi:hypothetical protein
MGESVERYEVDVPEGFEMSETEMTLGLTTPPDVGVRFGFNLRKRRVRRVKQLVEDVADNLETTSEAVLLELEEGDDARSAFFERALEDSAAIGDDEHRKHLAAVVARGIRGDTGRLDEAEVLRQLLRDLKPYHVRFLSFVQRQHEHQRTTKKWTKSTVTPHLISEGMQVSLDAIYEVVQDLAGDRGFLTIGGGVGGRITGMKYLAEQDIGLTRRAEWLLMALSPEEST